MKLLTKQILALLPPLYTNESKKPEETLVPVKFFNPGGAGSWFVTELDPATGEAFGYVTGLAENELGYISMEELSAFRGRFGLGIERDIHWDPKTTLAQVMKGEKSWGLKNSMPGGPVTSCSPFVGSKRNTLKGWNAWRVAGPSQCAGGRFSNTATGASLAKNANP